MAQKRFDSVYDQHPVILNETEVTDMVKTRMGRMNEYFAAIFVSNTSKVYYRFFHDLTEFRAYATMSRQSRSKSKLVAFYERVA